MSGGVSLGRRREGEGEWGGRARRMCCKWFVLRVGEWLSGFSSPLGNPDVSLSGMLAYVKWGLYLCSIYLYFCLYLSICISL